MSKVEILSPSDADLITQAQNGQVEAFGKLYERYLDPIYRYIRTRVDATEEAEDLCEAVFLRSFEALDRYQERGHPFSAYLYQVARNQLADYYRSQTANVDLEQIVEPADPRGDPEASYAQREQYVRAVRKLGELREDYQEVIQLRVVLELPTDTVAVWMDRSPGAVRVLLHRALVALRENLDEEHGA